MTSTLNAASIYNAFVNGEGLSEAEDEYGHKFESGLEKQLSECSTEFALARHEALNTANALEQFRDARKCHEQCRLRDKSE